MASIMRRASAWAMSVSKPATGNKEGSFTEAPLTSSALIEENVRVKNRAIKTVHGSDVAKVKSKIIAKTAVERDLLETALKANFVFAELNESQLDSMVLAFERQKVKAGTNLILQGTPGDFFYVVETGSFDFIVNGLKVGQCGACASFGELALLYGSLRAATVACTSASTVFALNRHVFKHTLANDVKEYGEAITETLRKVPMFREYLRLDEVQRIADVLEIVKYPKGAQIIKKGDVGTIFYILKEGTVQCTDIGAGDKKFPDVTLGPGKYFGERALISKDPRAATVIATEDVVLLSLNGTNFESLLGGLNSRMAAAAEEEDQVLTSSVGSMMARISGLGKPSTKKQGWTLTTRPDIALDSLQEVARLGSGSFGFVRMVLNDATHEVFALKSMLREDIKAQSSEQSVMDEKDLMADVAHPFVVNLVNTYKSSKRLYMLMECVQGGELYSRIHTSKNGALDSETVLFYTANMVVALRHLHAKDIVYRDLKPENILVDKTGYLKVCDFGFAVRLPLGHKTYTLCGTVEYLAPELLVGKGHNRGVDWWALGILMYEMLTCKTPFEDTARKEEATMRNILKQPLEFPSENSVFDETKKSFLSSLLQKNPLERLGSEYQDPDQVAKHPYFASLSFEAIASRTAPVPWVPELAATTDSSYFDA